MKFVIIIKFGHKDPENRRIFAKNQENLPLVRGIARENSSSTASRDCHFSVILHRESRN